VTTPDLPGAAPPANYRCRPMIRPELDLAIAWAAAEGWNPGPRDAAAFWAADPGGFWLGELDGTPVASISVVRYGADYGFLGCYIVRPEHRGSGLGLALWQRAMQHLAGRCVGLDGVVAQQDNYRRAGFTLAHRNIRYGLEGARPAPPPAGAVVPAATLPFATIAAYDRACVPAEREAFLRAWLTQPGHVALAVMRDGAIAGLGVMRPCPAGAKLGPLFADDQAAAETLFAALASAAPPGPLFLDVAEPHRAAVALAERAGMAPVFETARMYTRPPPAFAAARVWGITSFELG
jgi:GNAT superfamily N-acetyltransferase